MWLENVMGDIASPMNRWVDERGTLYTLSYISILDFWLSHEYIPAIKLYVAGKMILDWQIVLNVDIA